MLMKNMENVDTAHAVNTRYAKKGFSLIEMLIVLAIMGLFFGVAIPGYLSYVENARKTTARATLRQIQTDILRYYTDTNQYPEVLDDLVKEPSNDEARKNWGGPYLASKKVPLDPWGEKYVYRQTPDAEKPYELYSRGSKKKAGAKKDWISVWDEK